MDVTGIKVCLACFSVIKETLETFKLRRINLKDSVVTALDTIHTQQFDLQEAFKQMKADHSNSNARDNSKCSPNNDVLIHLGQFSWRMLHPDVDCSIMPTQTMARVQVVRLLYHNSVTKFKLLQLQSDLGGRYWHCSSVKQTGTSR